MQESFLLENEQETTKKIYLKIGWLAGVIDGEGTVALVVAKGTRNKDSGYSYTYHPRVNIYNNNLDLINEVISILDYFGIKSFVQARASRDPRNNNEELETVNYSLQVSNMESVRLLLELVVDLLKTHKYSRSKLCLRYINLRNDRTKFHYHSEEEIKVINEYLNLVGSSTTVRRKETGGLEAIEVSQETV
jgi:hypothetical protein